MVFHPDGEKQIKNFLASLDESFFTENGTEKYMAIEVFDYYFKQYREKMGREHPYVSNQTVLNIIEKMSCVYVDDGELSSTLDIDDYEEMINQHFETKYNNCDYNIVHFFSGDIRTYRYYETLY